MIRRKKFFLPGVVLLAAVIAGCDGYVGVNGRIVDAAGKPVGSVAVSLSRPGDAVGFDSKTGTDGCFALGGMVSPGKREYILMISAAEHKTFEGTYSSGGDHAVLVRLAADGTQGKSSARTLSDEESAAEMNKCGSSESVELDSRVTPGLPLFEDYPVPELFAGEPAAVDFDSHPDAENYRTALAPDAATGTDEARFAGHYRIVVIGCGSPCQSVWAIDLVDGSIHSLFTASYGTAYRPDSRLIVENDPAYYEGLLQEMPLAEVERQMDTYGPPRFWVENYGTFERVGPSDIRIDPRTKKLVAAPNVSRESP